MILALPRPRTEHALRAEVPRPGRIGSRGVGRGVGDSLPDSVVLPRRGRPVQATDLP